MPDPHPLASGRRRMQPTLAWRLGVASRAAAAIFGGYLLAGLAAAASAAALPGPPVEAALAGMLLSFVVYTVAVLWVFAARSAWRAWAGLLLPASALALVLLWHVQSRGGA